MLVRRCFAPTCEPEAMGSEAEHPLFLLYTSGSTGKPKGIQHASGGYLAQREVSHEQATIFDLRDDDVFWCTADVGWITGHSYIVYGPLAERCDHRHVRGRADRYPDIRGRFWRSAPSTA